MPSPRAVKLAISFAELAKGDAEASWILYQRKKYSQAVYFFQQAVEKDAKAIGLLTKSLNPTREDLVFEVGHNSILAILLRLPELIGRIHEMLPGLQEVLAKPEVKQFGLDRLMAPMMQNVKGVDTKSIQDMITTLKSPVMRRAWSLTLDLHPSQVFTKQFLGMLKDADKKSAEVDEAEIQLKKFQKRLLRGFRKFGDFKYSNSPEMSRFQLSLYRAVPELVPLGLVSLWHETPTRYPPIDETDYWSLPAYTAKKGLVRSFPLLHRHTVRLCQETLAAARFALKAHAKYEG